MIQQFNSQEEMDDLIKDDGEIRCCPSNRVKLGYWRSLWEFHGYGDLIRNFALEEVIEAFKHVALAILWLILFPVLPLVQCYYEHKRAVKEVAFYQKDKPPFQHPDL